MGVVTRIARTIAGPVAKLVPLGGAKRCHRDRRFFDTPAAVYL